MGGGTETTTSTTAPANPAITETTNKLLGGIREAYDKGPSVFNQPLYAGLGQLTNDGLSYTNWRASQSPDYFHSATDYAGKLVGGGGLTSGQQQNLGTQTDLAGRFGSIAGGLSQPSEAQNGLMGLYRQAGDPSLTENTMMGVARGDYLNNTDPNFQAMVDRVANQTSADINAAMGGNGRYGSNVHVGALGEEIGALRTNAAAQNRQLELSRQQQALGAIEGQRQTSFGNRAGALQAADASRLSQHGAQMGALGAQGDATNTAFGMGQQGIGNAMGAAAALPGLWSANLLPGQAMTQVGQMQDADRQAALLAQNDLHQRQTGAQRGLLGELSSILAGNAAVSGSTTSQTSPTTPWWQSALGIGLGLL